MPSSSYGNQFGADGVQFLWNASALSDWQKCPRYYQYVWLNGWTGAGLSPHLRFGDEIAKAMHLFHLRTANGEDREEVILDVVEIVLRRTADFKSDHRLKNRENLIRTIVWYFEEYNPDPLSTYVDEGGPALERQFRIAADDGVFLVGTLDRVIVYADALWIQDQKTTGGSLGPHYFEDWNLATQMFNYSFAGQMIFGESISGVMIDAMQIGANFSRFARQPIYKTRGQLDEWYDEAMQHIADARRATRERAFPRRLSSCTNYGGCAFASICSRPREVRENFLKSNFEKR